jgi:hypothetical protein
VYASVYLLLTAARNRASHSTSPFMAATTSGSVDNLEATLNFAQRTGADGRSPPRVDKTGGEGGAKVETMVSAARRTAILDARALPEPATLDRNGFALLTHATDVDFDDVAAVRSGYYPQMEAMVRRATGAARAVLFDHTLRRITPESAKQAAGGAGIGVAAIGGWATAGVNRVHGDYTLAGAPRRVVGLSAPSASGSFADAPPLTSAEAERIVAGRRFAVVNVWRSTALCGRPVETQPLAVLDCSSVRPGGEHLFTVELVFYSGRVIIAPLLWCAVCGVKR